MYWRKPGPASLLHGGLQQFDLQGTKIIGSMASCDTHEIHNGFWCAEALR